VALQGMKVDGCFCREVKAAAKAAGAYGCTISGAGPTCVAVVADQVLSPVVTLQAFCRHIVSPEKALAAERMHGSSCVTCSMQQWP